MGYRQRGGSTAQRGRRKRNGDTATFSRTERDWTERAVPAKDKISGSAAAGDGDALDGHRHGLRVLKSGGGRSAGDANCLVAEGESGGGQSGLREGRGTQEDNESCDDNSEPAGGSFTQARIGAFRMTGTDRSAREGLQLRAGKSSPKVLTLADSSALAKKISKASFRNETLTRNLGEAICQQQLLSFAEISECPVRARRKSSRC